MKMNSTRSAVNATALVTEAWEAVSASFERFCLTAGVATLTRMMEEDATTLCGARYGRPNGKSAGRWGKTKGKIGFHGGKVEVERPRVRARSGGELALPSWEAAQSEDLLGKWAMNLMPINVSTRGFGRAVRLPGGDIPAGKGDGRSKSAVSRRFVALSAEHLAEWMGSDLSKLELLAIQIRACTRGGGWGPYKRGVDAGRGGRDRCRGDQTPAGRDRGRDGERRDGSGAAG